MRQLYEGGVNTVLLVERYKAMIYERYARDAIDTRLIATMYSTKRHVCYDACTRETRSVALCVS